MFITLEGPDGSGKTTQIPALVKAIEGMGYSVVVTREPGGTEIGDEIRQIIMNLKNKEMHPTTETLLFQASRAQLVNTLIRPALAEGKVVLCDRYDDSTLAYQGYGHKTDLERLKGVIEFATGGLKPDLTFFLDVDAETGLQRRAKDKGQWNRMDDYQVEFHARVRAGYEELIAAEPTRWVRVDAMRKPEFIAEDLRHIVLARLAAANQK